MSYWIQISSGRGPVECCWVVAKVADRILAEAKQNKFKASVIRSVPGPKPKTLKSVLISIGGDGMEEFLRQWEGTVQWTGKSLFRQECKRKNWFVSVEIFRPEAGAGFKLNEFKFEYMRSSGPGGQHVNKTESAVRARHMPTGLTAIASEERSQHCNKKLAIARLKKLIKGEKEKAQRVSKQRRWNQHNFVERGNAVRVFKQRAFIEK